MKLSSFAKNLEQNASRLLSDRGLKKTKTRLSILNLLLSSKKPLSHQDISHKIPGLDKVTVYRVLSSFLDKNIAHRIETQDHVWHFAVCPCGHTAHCHPHFSCRKCGRIECLSDVKLPVWSRSATGHVVENQEIYLHGLCVQCATR
ncbi:MAG TPA: transcriptional repressor [Chitinivibrionales bacterium]|nr:transcriptional repressor [Chitinivibrionales bacterium]